MLKQETVIERSAKTENTIHEFLIKDTLDKKLGLEKNTLTLSRRKYPDFRFFCPNCSTLDVLIKRQSFDLLRGLCLECKMEWNEVNPQ